MDITTICSSLRLRLNEFKSTDVYHKSKPHQFNIHALEIAINLAELKHYHSRKIENHEWYWFEGGYFFSFNFAGEWEDISRLYDELAKAVKFN